MPSWAAWVDVNVERALLAMDAHHPRQPLPLPNTIADMVMFRNYNALVRFRNGLANVQLFCSGGGVGVGGVE